MLIQTLFNCKLTSKCGYKKKNKTFHCFYDKKSKKYGLGFHDSEQSLIKANRYFFCFNLPYTINTSTYDINIQIYGVDIDHNKGISI